MDKPQLTVEFVFLFIKKQQSTKDKAILKCKLSK